MQSFAADLWLDLPGTRGPGRASPIVERMAEEGGPTDEELLALLSNGDGAAFGRFYDRFHESLYRFALRMSGSTALAEDVTQEVFLALIDSPARYDPARGALAPYLYGVARNKLLQRIDRDRPYVPMESAEEEIAPDKHPPLSRLIRSERTALVWKALLALPVHYREAVVLCDLQRLSYAEAAAALGCPVGTVRSLLHRGRELLAERLRAGGPGGGRMVE